MHRERRLLRVTGVVQGVGFRPFVHRLATRLGVEGSVHNDGEGVVVTALADAGVIDRFVDLLRTDAPPLARVDSVVVLAADPTPDDAAPGFHIVASGGAAGGLGAALPADTAVCEACVRELFDPTDRRHRHPFITCTDCGPRFTITRRLPYDRPNTTMDAFPMCAACAAEYHDETDRRFHAQPIGCHDCGPQLRLTDREGHVVARRDEALRAAVRALVEGSIVAVKSLGGYHLVCDASNPASVAELRDRKRRGDKPWAVLVDSLTTVRSVAWCDDAEAGALQSPERPIVLLRRRTTGAHPSWVDHAAPGLHEIGVMLPATPLQHLLLVDSGLHALVCTSGNIADEPIVTDDDRARLDLGHLADHFLANDRGVHVACDDSIVRVVSSTSVPVRRARGYTPLPIPVDRDGATVLAMGGDLKGALCLLSGSSAVMSAHLGDHGRLATHDSARAAAAHLCALVGARPEVVAVDRHPGYLSSRLGHELAAEWGARVVEVQHHHAHAIAVAGEHRVDGPVIAVTFDGTGYGDDGSVWGGEVLIAERGRFRRTVSFAPLPLPGGDDAVHAPALTALAALWASGIEWSEQLPCVRAVEVDERRLLATRLDRGVGVTPCSSAGRLFDAIASIAGLRHRVDFEAQAAIDLETAADPEAAGSYRFPGPGPDGRVDATPVLRAAVDDVLTGVAPGTVAARFHRAVVDHVHAAVDATRTLALGVGMTDHLPVVLSGGVFQNRWIAEGCAAALGDDGRHVFGHRLVPTNDGGLALGQALIARHVAGVR